MDRITQSIVDSARDAQAERSAATQMIAKLVEDGHAPDAAGMAAALEFPGVAVNYLRGHVALFYGGAS